LRSVDEIAGQLFSIPRASKKILGTQVQEFENELKQKLGRLIDGQKFNNHVQFSMYIFGKIRTNLFIKTINFLGKND
jgi:hypothetical protein